MSRSATRIFKGGCNTPIASCCISVGLFFHGLVYAQTNEVIAGSVIFDRPETVDSSFFTLTFENDLFVGEDDGFTNGIGFTFGRGPFLSFSESNLPAWLNALSKRTYIQTMPDKVRGVAYMFFQNMQTILIYRMKNCRKTMFRMRAWQRFKRRYMRGIDINQINSRFM